MLNNPVRENRLEYNTWSNRSFLHLLDAFDLRIPSPVLDEKKLKQVHISAHSGPREMLNKTAKLQRYEVAA